MATVENAPVRERYRREREDPRERLKRIREEMAAKAAARASSTGQA